MQVNFPYKIYNQSQIIQQINRLSVLQKPFLFIIDYKAEKGFVIPENELDEQFVRFRLPGTDDLQQRATGDVISGSKFDWRIKPINFDVYRQKFGYVQQQIHQGNSFLTNLTQPTEIETNLTLFDLFQIGTAKYKLWLNDKFTVLSPESFIKITDAVISSFPMKGTIDASIPNAEKIILNDTKEKAEHATIVDLIRNDLSMVAENVEVKRYRYIDKIRTNKGDLLQVSSEICGQLPVNFHERLGDIIFALLPAGSICGAPKPKTLQIIEQAEEYNRDFYTGIFGYFDGKNLDSAVMIRFIEQNENRLIFKSGGGITSKSELEKEYEELIQKVYVPFC